MERTYEPPLLRAAGEFAALTCGEPWGRWVEFVTGWVRLAG
jgi:hypothetical protein